MTLAYKEYDFSVEHKASDRCTKCGGKCCLIYRSVLAGGQFPEGQTWFQEWCDDFHKHPETYGVEPLFDPLEAHMTGKEDLREDLRKRGINPDACQYVGKQGCLIPWDKRPDHCKNYRCQEWVQDDIRNAKLGVHHEKN
jgi:hypothetical protein